MTSIVERKRAELRLKLQSLSDDFADWKGRSATVGSELRKHHTQIDRLTTQLSRAHAKLGKEVESRAFDALDGARDLERNVLALFRIWDFFRAKLSQRDSARLRSFLAAADDFAIACYDPLMNAAFGKGVTDARRKAQPLTFLNGGTSPFVQTRDDGFEVEDTMGDGQPRGKLGDLIRALPVTVVGLPWHEVAHVPELLLLAHEMGHVAEYDFALTKELEKALGKSGVAAQRLPTWNDWFAEAFADVFGALTGGPAFVGALVDLLAEPKSVVLSDGGDAPSHRGSYPSAMIRVRLAVETIRLAGHATEADRRLAEWHATYGEAHDLSDYDDECAIVAAALVDAELEALGKHSLASLVAYDAAMHDRATLAASRLLKRQEVTTKDPRELLSAVRLAFEAKPQSLLASRKGGTDGGGRYGGSDIIQRVLGILDAKRSQAVRGAAVQASDPALVAVDEAAGDDWFAALAGLKRPP